MQTLAIRYRAAQLYAHMAHNLISGPTFFADHSFLADLYSAYEDAYDAVIERMIGLGDSPDIVKITITASGTLEKVKASSDPAVIFKLLLAEEENIRDDIKALVPKASDGTQNLLQGLADDSEVRTYKMQQRTA